MSNPLQNPVLNNHFQAMLGLPTQLEVHLDSHNTPIRLLSVEVAAIPEEIPAQQIKKIAECWNKFALLPNTVPEYEQIKAKLYSVRNKMLSVKTDNETAKAYYIMASILMEHQIETIFSAFKKDREKSLLEIFKSLVELSQDLVEQRQLDSIQIPLEALNKSYEIVSAPKIDDPLIPASITKKITYFNPLFGPISLLSIAALGSRVFPTEVVKAGFAITGRSVAATGNLVGKTIESAGNFSVGAIEGSARIIAEKPKFRNALIQMAAYWAAVDLLEAGTNKLLDKIHPLLIIPAAVGSGIVVYNAPPLQRIGAYAVKELQSRAALISALMLTKYYLFPQLPNIAARIQSCLSFVDIRKHLPSSITDVAAKAVNKLNGMINSISFWRPADLEDLERMLTQLRQDTAVQSAEKEAMINALQAQINAKKDQQADRDLR